MAKILVVEGNTRAASERMIQLGEQPYGPAYAELLCTLAPGIECTIVCPCEDGPECLPAETPLAGYDAVAWTGSSLNIYDRGEAIENQRELAGRILEAQKPIFGSCWGLQLFAEALGGKVRKNPKGREIGLAREIALNAAGLAHPMFETSQPVFEALAVHLDEVEELPQDAMVLASNAMSHVQALVIEKNGVDFWGVQYHPEFDCAGMAKVIKRHGNRLVADGNYASGEDMNQAIEHFEALHREANGQIDASCTPTGMPRRLELVNWLRRKILCRDRRLG